MFEIRFEMWDMRFEILLVDDVISISLFISYLKSNISYLNYINDNRPRPKRSESYVN